MTATVGVAGTGTMGAGIAQVACLGALETRLHDPDPDALERGLSRLREDLLKGAQRGRWSEADAAAALERVHPSPRLEDLAGCELVIEAAPEDLELKRDLFARLAEVCGAETVLATNTSSLSVADVARGVPHPERVIGMHFFNPPVLMKLVEIVAGDESSDDALDIATDAAERMGRAHVRAADAPGFLANRCARPFFLEPLRMLGERVAGHETIDRVCRLGGGFRMGPFELIDLIGVDVNLSVARSFFQQSGGEPRWRPHPIQQQLVDEGRLGRKSGRGFYEYPPSEPRRPEDPEVEAERPIFDRAVLQEVAGPSAPEMLDRLGAQIANEAAFALEAGIGSAQDIDTAMRLGFNWPLGPVEWGRRMGPARAVAVLDDLRELHGDPYRVAPLLRAGDTPFGGEPRSGQDQP